MRDLFEKNPFLEKVSAGKAPVGYCCTGHCRDRGL